MGNKLHEKWFALFLYSLERIAVDEGLMISSYQGAICTDKNKCRCHGNACVNNGYFMYFEFAAYSLPNGDPDGLCSAVVPSILF